MASAFAFAFAIAAMFEVVIVSTLIGLMSVKDMYVLVHILDDNTA
ncbi:hypothetical protein VOA_002908 [Vibrio sp. RC586]|nr:hypothetical protein VOA_002908 [Vibrio sp. RC586]